jgi:titin
MPLKNYIIEMREAKHATWKKVTTTEPNITSYCLQKLVENVDYFFRVSAENKVGISEPLEMDQPITIKSPYGRLCLA